MKMKKQRKQIQGVYDGEHTKKKSNKQEGEKTYGAILREERNSMIEEQFEEP